MLLAFRQSTPVSAARGRRRCRSGNSRWPEGASTMQMRLRILVLGATPMLLSACATHGWVHKELATQRAQIDAEMSNNMATANAALVSERSARVASDSILASRDEQLRAEIEALRSQFNAKIAMMDGAMRFAMPVTFAYDDATVSDGDRAMVERFAQVAQRYYKGSMVTVEGFADPAGTESYNLDLSRRRAENVRTMLGSLGLPENQVRAVGYGEKRQVSPGASRDEAGAQENRRVVFVIDTKGGSGSVALSRPNE